MDDWDPADQTEGEDRRALKDSEWEELRQAGNDHYAVCKMLLSDVLGSAKDSGEAPFDAKMWNYLAHGELPSAPTGRKEKMQHDIEVKNLKRAKDASRPGGSMENQCYYIYKYAKNRDSLDALVSLHRCIEALRGFGRQGTARAEQELAELLDEKLARTSGPALLKLVAEEEETLGRNTFKLNARPRLYEEQQRFVALLTRPGPQLVYYTTPPSSGKTFSVAIAALVVQKTRLRRALSYVLYTVYNENVRIDVCKTLLGCQLPFLICRGGNFSVSPTCFHKNARAVDTASIACVQQRLAKVARAVDVMPVAVVADLESAQKLLHAMSPSDRADVVTIVDEPVVSNSHIGRQYADLMRASTPRVVLMSASIPAGGLKNYTEHYTAAHGGSVSYIEKTSVKSVPLSLYLGGELMMPHELGAGVADIEADPFLQRFYSVHALARIGLPERRNPKQLLTQEGILELCMERLRENCATTLTPPVVEPPEGLAKMLTSGSNGYQGITLVLVRDPREVDEPVGELLSESSYSLEKFLKKRDASEWPCVVNSKAHTARYHAKGERIPPFRLKMCPPLSDVVVQTSNATLVENALSGVFVLTDQRLDRMLRYNLTNLANGCYESMIVADESIVFGTNLPIDNIVCRLGKRLPSFAWKQLIGRAGRTGKSYRASVRVYSLEDVESIFETGAGCAIDEAFRRD